MAKDTRTIPFLIAIQSHTPVPSPVLRRRGDMRAILRPFHMAMKVQRQIAIQLHMMKNRPPSPNRRLSPMRDRQTMRPETMPQNASNLEIRGPRLPKRRRGVSLKRNTELCHIQPSAMALLMPFSTESKSDGSLIYPSSHWIGGLRSGCKAHC